MVAELFGYLGLIIFFISYFILNPRHIMAFWAAANICFIGHFMLYGAHTAMAIASINSSRDLFGIFIKTDTLLRKSMFLCAFLVLILMLFQAKSASDYIACGAALTGYFIPLLRNRYWPFMAMSLVCNGSWILYDLMIQSTPALLTHSMMIIACFGGMGRKFLSERKTQKAALLPPPVA